MHTNINVEEHGGQAVMPGAQIHTPASQYWPNSHATAQAAQLPEFDCQLTHWPLQISLTDIGNISDYEASRAEQLGSCHRLALVVWSAVDFGLNRMYQIWSEHYPREVRISHSLAEARAWVSADEPVARIRARGPHPAEPTATRRQ